MVKNLPAMWETWLGSLWWEDPQEEGMATPTPAILPGEFQGLWQAIVHVVTESNAIYQLSTHGYMFSSVVQSCPTLCDPMNHSTPGLPVHHHLPESTQTHVHWVSDAIQPSHLLLSPSSPAFNLSQHQGLFKWVSSSHQVAKVLEFQLQHQSFQWTSRTDLV